jgi:hypothetical protein
MSNAKRANVEVVWDAGLEARLIGVLKTLRAEPVSDLSDPMRICQALATERMIIARTLELIRHVLQSSGPPAIDMEVLMAMDQLRVTAEIGAAAPFHPEMRPAPAALTLPG